MNDCTVSRNLKGVRRMCAEGMWGRLIDTHKTKLK